MRVQDKVVVITGATKGVGKGIALCLAEEGARVVVSGRNTADGQGVADQIARAGGQALFVQADVSREADCQALIHSSWAHFGRIDGLVNNAGIFPHLGLMDTDRQVLDQVLSTNLGGALYCTKAVLPYMQKSQGGSIVNIGSTHWEMGDKLLTAYACSKGALHTLTQHVAAHYARDQIRCNWVTVGWVLSEGEVSRHYEAGHDDAWIEALGKRYIPFGQFQTARDIGYACLYLLSDESRQVTATDIKVTGGFEPRRQT